MCHLDVVTNEKHEKYTLKWPYILDHIFIWMHTFLFY